MDAGRLREGLDDLVKLADYVVCAARFLQRILPLKKWMLTNYWNPCKRERTEAHTSQPAYHQYSQLNSKHFFSAGVLL
ncbi:hypothetical protein JHK82_053883 [Glycine max]|nr:hypothetical protein JHK82_053883 [Glycine max]